MDASLRTTHSYHYDLEVAQRNARVYSHIKPYATKGLIQINGPVNAPDFQILASVGTGGVLVFKIPFAFEDSEICPQKLTPDDQKDIHVSFLNQTPGNNYSHSGNLFSELLSSCTVSFLKRNNKEQTEFVRSEFKMRDQVTLLSHCTSVTSWPLCVKDLKTSLSSSKLLFSVKTSTMLQKWLKTQKTRERQAVRISVNQLLSVVVFSIGTCSKTVDFTPIDGNPEVTLLFAEKKGDFGVVDKDMVYTVAIDSLTAALGICRVPAACLPCLNFHVNGLLEVVALPFKGAGASHSTLSVLLLKTNPEADLQSIVESHDSAATDEVAAAVAALDEEQIASHIPGTGSSLPPTLDPADVCEELSTIRKEDIEANPCGLSDPRLTEPGISGNSCTTLKPRKIEKRRKEVPSREGKTKKPKLTFNPLI